MKKIIISTLIGFGLAGISWGNPIEFGFKGGINFASLVNRPDFYSVTSAQEVGFIGGIYAGIPLNNFLSLQPGFDYSMKGIHYNLKAFSENSPFGYIQVQGDGTSDERSDYLELPLLLKGSVHLGTDLKFSLLAGASAAYLLSEQYSYHYTNPPTLSPASGKYSFGGGNSLDFNFILGFEAEFENFILDARWSVGFPYLFPANNGDNITDDVISLQGGYRIF